MASNNTPLVSVLLNTYNYGHFLEKAIVSVFDQTLPLADIEIIVVDDGSTDDTAERMESYKDRVIYVYQENHGQASAFNRGFEQAKGEFIAFLDSDDYFAPDKLRIAVDYLRKYDDLDIFYHNLAVVDGNCNFLHPYFSHIPEAAIPKKIDRDHYLQGYVPTFPPTSGMMFRKSCLDKIMPVPKHYDICADTYLHYFGFLYADKTLFIPYSIGFYRMHGQNNFWNGDEINKHQKLIRIYTLLIGDLNDFGIHSNIDISLLTRKISTIVEFWKIELKIHRIFKSHTVLKVYYLLRKGLILFNLALKGNPVRHFYKNQKHSILNVIRKFF